jgi:putative FmdB family regulatory protein
VPTYQYACTTCAEQVEAMQRFSDDPLTVCPACGGTLRKVFSPVGIVFKGSGFYHTDSRQRATTAAKSDGAKDGKVKESAGSAESASKDSSSASGSSSADAKKPAGSKSSQPVGASSSAR